MAVIGVEIDFRGMYTMIVIVLELYWSLEICSLWGGVCVFFTSLRLYM